jgi:hypothetical protein
VFSSHTQTADLGLSRPYFENYLRNCGYWANEDRRAQLAYVPSPSVYIATKRQEADLERMAKATYLAVHGLNVALCKTAGEKNLTKEAARFLQLGNSASRGLLRPQDGETRIPPMIKVDLVQDVDGMYQIAEVDTYNPRGFGFAAMLEESLQSDLKLRRFPGMEQLCRILKTNGVSDDTLWFVLVSEFERFYRPAYEIFSRALKRRGIHMPTISTHEVSSVFVNEHNYMKGGVFSIPDTLFTEDPAIRTLLLEKYRDKSLEAVYPPVAYLGSKAFLPYLRMFAGMGEFLPKTRLVGKHYPEPENTDLFLKQVLKATVSSGMKGVYFSDTDEEYPAVLEKARAQRNPSWILQEQVPQVPVPIIVFDDDGNRVTRDYYLRLTAYISVNGIIDVEVTGRPDKKVHGAPDCIQIPVVLS